MIGVWWEPAGAGSLDLSTREQRRAGLSSHRASGLAPLLHHGGREEVKSRLLGRRRAYTPEWTGAQESMDAGLALVRLFGEMIEPISARVNRWPHKAFVEFLRAAGITALTATPASVLLEFTASSAARDSVLVPNGFQVSAPPADDSTAPVIFETDQTLYVAPATIAALYAQEGNLFRKLEAGKSGASTPLLPFGEGAEPGSAFWIGLRSGIRPAPTISVGLGIVLPGGAPPPVRLGGVMPVPGASAPLLRWEAANSEGGKAVEVLRDGTGGLARSGVVELRTPREWEPVRPDGIEEKEAHFWLRLVILSGQPKPPPVLTFVRLNMVPALAVRTIRDEVLTPLPDSSGRRMRLSQTPVLAGSLSLEVDENEEAHGGLAGDEASAAAPAEPGRPAARRAVPWREVEGLSKYGPTDRVFVLDRTLGHVQFGDGVHGAALPEGFRHVRAAAYRVGGGRAGAVGPEEVKGLVSSAPFLTAVTNPFAASGGTAPEIQAETLLRGPQEIRARGRSVAVTDYALLACQAPGADCARAHAVSGFHPSYPGRPTPGVVAVFVVPFDRRQGMPVPDVESLRRVAQHLSGRAAPAGVEVVAAAPHFHRVRIEAGIIIKETAEAGGVLAAVLREIDKYLHPLTGGEEGRGWPFGGPLRYAPLVRRLLARVDDLRAIPTLRFVVDGLRSAACDDRSIRPHALLWPDTHFVFLMDPEEGEP